MRKINYYGILFNVDIIGLKNERDFVRLNIMFLGLKVSIKIELLLKLILFCLFLLKRLEMRC